MRPRVPTAMPDERDVLPYVIRATRHRPAARCAPAERPPHAIAAPAPGRARAGSAGTSRQGRGNTARRGFPSRAAPRQSSAPSRSRTGRREDLPARPPPTPRAPAPRAPTRRRSARSPHASLRGQRRSLARGGPCARWAVYTSLIKASSHSSATHGRPPTAPGPGGSGSPLRMESCATAIGESRWRRSPSGGKGRRWREGTPGVGQAPRRAGTAQ